MKTTIKDFNLNSKKVIIRCDFNVPIKNNQIMDDNRIKESIKTIEYAINNNAKVILLSHLGRVKSEEDKKNSLKPVAERLSLLLNQEVKFINENQGTFVEKTVNEMKNKDVILLENTRFQDFPDNKESKNDFDLGKYWASLGDIFINDAFGTSHRSHASNVGIASNLPNGVGFLIEKEINTLTKILTEPEKPFTVVLGGAKVADKIKVIENIIEHCDYMLIAGGMAFTFLKAKGKNIGKSLLDEDSIDFCKNLLKKYENKIILPKDVICAKEYIDTTDRIEVDINNIPSDYMALDIGEKTIAEFKQILKKTKTVLWNGPVGVSEFKNFSFGTTELIKFIVNLNIESIIAGGDTVSAVTNMGYKDKFSHVSTGGGATLEFLEGKELDGIKIINDQKA